MNVKRVCNKCGEINTIDSSNLIREDVYDEYGEYYKVMYYDCKRCNERITVQIDNMETLSMFRDLKALIGKAMRKNAKGETISPKDIRKKDKLTKELAEKRKILNDLVMGKTFYDKDNKIVIKELTFPKVGDIIENNL